MSPMYGLMGFACELVCLRGLADPERLFLEGEGEREARRFEGDGALSRRLWVTEPVLFIF